MNTSHPNETVLDGPSGLRFVHIDYTSDFQMPPHTHEGVASLNFCLRGTHQEFWDRKTFLRGASSLSLMPAGVSHSNRFSAGASTFLVVLGATWIRRLHHVSTLMDSPLCFHNGPPTWIATRMYREFLRRDDLTPLALEGMLLELMVELARMGSLSGRDHTRSEEGNAPLWLREATDFLHAHFTETLTSEAIAAAAGVHPSHLMRAFRRRHGYTVGEYVRRLRLEYARHLLATSDTPLGQIALDVGFCDQGHFGRAFKAHVGVSPGEMRRACGHASHIQEVPLSS